MSSVWEEERRETGAAASPPPPSPRPPLRLGVTLGMRQILNGSCKVTSREGAEAEAEAEEEVYQGTHLVGIIASSSLPSCVGVCVCAPLPSPFETLKASEGVYRRCTCTGSACGVFHVFLREGNDRAAAASLNSGTVSP